MNDMFLDIYKNEILPILYKLEKKRKQKIVILFLIGIIFLLLELFLVYKTYYLLFVNTDFTSKCNGAILFLILPAVFYVIVAADASDFKTTLKRNLKSKVIKCFCDINYGDFTHEFNIVNIIKESMLFDNIPESFDYNFDDIFMGKRSCVNLVAADFDMFIRSSRGARSRIFKGAILSFISNKKISARTNIYPKFHHFMDNKPIYLKDGPQIVIIISMCILIFKDMIYLRVSGDTFIVISLILASFLVICFYVVVSYLRSRKPKNIKDFNSVKLEDADFNKNYVVLSEDQVEARYLITPSFIDRFKELAKVYNAKHIRCAFYDDKVLFAINTNKDLFEFGSLFHTLLDVKYIENYYDEIKVIFDIVDLFRLDEKTGL